MKVKPQEISVSELKLHTATNRAVRPGRVRQLERTMDVGALGRFAVWRDGHNLYVIDGQHRKLALESLGMGDIRVRCDVYEGISFSDACEIFLKLNDGLIVRPWDKFDKGVKAGRMAETETYRVVTEAGFKMADQAADGNLICVAAAVETWKLDEGEALRTALRVASEAWGHTASAAEGTIVRALGLVAHNYNGSIDYAALIKKLSKYSGGPTNLVGQAKAQRDYKGGTVARNAASIIVSLYNKGRRTGQVDPI